MSLVCGEGAVERLSNTFKNRGKQKDSLQKQQETQTRKETFCSLASACHILGFCLTRKRRDVRKGLSELGAQNCDAPW
jgi:hypothetical protein